MYHAAFFVASYHVALPITLCVAFAGAIVAVASGLNESRNGASGTGKISTMIAAMIAVAAPNAISRLI